MQKRYPILFLLIAFLTFIPTSYGALDLRLTKGMITSVPIALMPFSGLQALAPGGQTIPEIIKNDLQNSGQFRVLSPDDYLDQNTISLQQIDYSYWHKKKVSAIVVGTIHSLRARRYQVTFALVNTFGSNDVLLNESFNVNARDLRNLAHCISNLIYQKLTGVRGIFSTKIAYVLVNSVDNTAAKYILEIADADGFNPQPLLVSDMPIMSPAWSPDGTKIAYVSFEGHHSEIYLQDLAIRQRQRLSNAPGINGSPAFSPDGKQLAIVLSKTGNPKIYILNLANLCLHEITKGWSIDTEPVWSPNGKSLLFTSNRDGTPQIYDYSFTNGTISRVTYHGDYNARASFFPNAKSIIIMHRENGLFGIASQDLTTGQVQILTESGTDESPSLAPNGKMIIYATKYAGHDVLAQISINGQIKLYLLPAPDGNVQEPAWSPFLGRDTNCKTTQLKFSKE